MPTPLPMVIILLLVAACAPQAWGAAAQKATGPRTGLIEDDLKGPDGAKIIHYVMATPLVLPRERSMALLVCFHGNGHTADTHCTTWADQVRSSGLQNEWVVLSLKSKGAYWQPVDDAPVTAAIEWALDTYPIDRRRVFAYGFSAGAWYVGTYGMANQQRFAGLSLFASAPDTAPAPLGGGDAAPAVYVYVGTNDDLIPKDMGVKYRDQLRARGFRHVFREVAGGGHDLGPGELIKADTLRWMQQLRSAHAPLSPEQEAFLAEATAKKPEEVWTNAQSAQRVLAIGGQHAAALAARVADSANDRARINAAKAAGSGQFGAAMTSQLAAWLDVKSASLRTQAIAALGNAAHWNDPEARRLLVAIANDRERTMLERQHAVMAMGAALKYIALSDRYCDRHIVHGLVGLLDAPEAGLRAGAFALLGPLAADPMGYEPGAANRAKAIERWSAWATARCGAGPDAPPATAQ